MRLHILAKNDCQMVKECFLMNRRMNSSALTPIDSIVSSNLSNARMRSLSDEVSGRNPFKHLAALFLITFRAYTIWRIFALSFATNPGGKFVPGGLVLKNASSASNPTIERSIEVGIVSLSYPLNRLQNTLLIASIHF